jgi:hypothetical protein
MTPRLAKLARFQNRRLLPWLGSAFLLSGPYAGVDHHIPESTSEQTRFGGFFLPPFPPDLINVQGACTFTKTYQSAVQLVPL